MKRIQQITQRCIRAVQAAYHRRRIAQTQGKMERAYLRGTPLTADQMVRWSVLISQHSISCNRADMAVR